MKENDEITNLYRHFDADNQLLYVGISLSAVHRLTEHRNGSPWFRSIGSVTIETFPSRKEALAAEKEAIRNENPLYNVAGKPLLHIVATTPEHSDRNWSRAASLKAWRAANPDKVRQHNATNYETHKDQRAEYRADHRELYRDATLDGERRLQERSPPEGVISGLRDLILL